MKTACVIVAALATAQAFVPAPVATREYLAAAVVSHAPTTSVHVTVQAHAGSSGPEYRVNAFAPCVHWSASRCLSCRRDPGVFFSLQSC
jgi:hypothetical protein